MQNPCVERATSSQSLSKIRFRRGGGFDWAEAAKGPAEVDVGDLEPLAAPLCYGSATSIRGQDMNRNVTIGLGTLIIIIIVVALLF